MAVSASSAHELVDVVDEHDRVVGVVARAEMRAHRLRHRAVSIAVFGSDGRLLVHRRADTKDVWPGMWDIAAGGVVAAGEDCDEAAVRELAEELGVAGVTLEPIGRGAFNDHAVSSVLRCYRCVHDGPFTFTDGEIAEVRWVDTAGLARLMAREPFVPDNTAVLLPLLHLR
jgi:8-oxo-dGTP pyrophosphatase MutT (NUDIX family)